MKNNIILLIFMVISAVLIVAPDVYAIENKDDDLDQSFLQAVINREYTRANLLLNEGANINAQTSCYLGPERELGLLTALMITACQGYSTSDEENKKFIQRLLQDPRLDLNVVDHLGRNIFLRSVYVLDRAMIDKLLKHARPNESFKASLAEIQKNALPQSYFSILPKDIMPELSKLTLASSLHTLTAKDFFDKDALFYLTCRTNGQFMHNCPWYSSKFELAHMAAMDRRDIKEKIQQVIQ